MSVIQTSYFPESLERKEPRVICSKNLLDCVNEPNPPVFDNRKLFDKAKVEKSEKSIEWGTPPEVYDPLNAEFGFTLDVCATAENAKCARYYTQSDDALKQPWEGVCWMNPPFGRCVKDWILKAKREAEIGRATTVCLIPAKTNTNWWHDLVINHAEIRFVRGRIAFYQNGKQSTSELPWPMAVIIYRAKQPNESKQRPHI